MTCQLPAQHGLFLWLTPFSGAENLLLDAHARVYVADLPPKYNLYIMAQEGCEDGIFLRNLLSNPLGPLLNASLDSALYRWAPSRGRECLISVRRSVPAPV